MPVPIVIPVFATLIAAIPPAPSVHFEPNRGQFHSDVRFAARAGSKIALVRDNGLEWQSRSSRVRMRVEGASAHPRWDSGDPLQSTSNYFVGNNPRAWKSAVPNLGRVTARQIIPGVDVAYYGSGSRVEFDFLVAPGADPRRIEMSFSGHNSIAIDSSGDLILRTSGGESRQHRPTVYQTIAGRRTPVAAEYEFRPRGRIGFKLGGYDPRAPLVIDPLITFSTYAGGDKTDITFAAVTDAAGNIYVAGGAESANFPSTPGAYQPVPKTGPVDAVVLKYDSAGRLLFSTFIGGAQTDSAYALALDINGNILVGGGTTSNDMPVSESAYQKIKKTNEDGWLAKLSPSGSSLAWLTYIGGSTSQLRAIGDWINSIAVDANGSAYVTGQTCATDFPTTPGAVRTPNLGLCDIFVTKFTPSGSALVYSATFGGSLPDLGQSIAIDPSGNAYVTGWVWSEDVAATAGVVQRSFAGGVTDVILAKINPSGTAFVYLTYLGGSDDEYPYGMALDRAGNVYVTGYTYSANYPTTPGYQPNLGGKSDGFVTKVNPAATAIVYSAFVGSIGDETVRGIAIDERGNAYLTGETDSTNFRTTPGAIQTQKAAALDAFLMRLDPEGKTAVYSTLLGGNGIDIGRGIALDPQGSAVITGSTDSGNFPVSPGAPQGDWKGESDAFITKVDFLAGIAATLAIDGGNNQSAPVGQSLANPLVVLVRDGRGNPVGGVTVTFAGTNAQPVSAIATTDAAGRASTRVTLGNTIGSASVSAAVAGLPAVNFAATADPFIPPVTITRIVNGGSFNENLAPGAYVTIFGANLAAATAQASTTPLPTTLAAVQVLINGKAAPLLYVSPAQINAQLPYDAGVGLASAIVVSGPQQSTAATFVVIPAAPGILQYGAGRAVAQNQDYSLNTAEAPAAVGTYITVYLTGIGQLDNPIPAGSPTPESPFSRPLLGPVASIGGKSADLAFIGMTPGFVGLAQANLKVPELATGEHSIVITVGTVASNPAKINVAVPPTPL